MYAKSNDSAVAVTTTATRLLFPDEKRKQWTITNPGSVTIYYRRGAGGAAVAASGNEQGVPVPGGDWDGYDGPDAHDEVFIIGVSATTIILGTT